MSDTTTTTVKLLIFKRFERFWHWSQVLLIFILIVTGFRVHGTYSFFSFESSVMVHTGAALILMILWVFVGFWLITTGQWRHYTPTNKHFMSVTRYYIFGIFKGENHPYRKTYLRKHNPLQALSYLSLKLLIFPVILFSGMIYLLISFGLLSIGNQMYWVSFMHIFAAIAIVIFIIVHIYLLTTGGSFKKHIEPMITGYDDVDLSDEELAYIRKDEPSLIKE